MFVDKESTLNQFNTTSPKSVLARAQTGEQH
jgi:hypothetical protein